MKLTIDFDLDAEEMAWLWAEWLYENSTSPRMPESAAELGEKAKDLLRNLAFSNHPRIPCDMIEKALESQMPDKSMDELIEELSEHIKNFPEWED